MKATRTAPVPVRASACRSKWIALLLAACLLAVPARFKAAEPGGWATFTDGERISMHIFFKWGLIMPKAGEAQLEVACDDFRGSPSWRYELSFRTVGIFEHIFPMRDTLRTYFTRPGTLPVFSEKRSFEGKYYSVDEITFFPSGDDSVRVHSLRYTPDTTKIDTVLCASAPLYDMLGATMFLRTMDWERLEGGSAVPFRVAIGRDVVYAAYRYTGQEIVERDGVKFSTRHFFIDVYDEAFTQSRAAGEAWIGDDENHLPIKLRAKLKIGAAEAYYVSSENTRYPVRCALTIHSGSGNR